MVSARGQDHCDPKNSSTDWRASFSFIKAQIALALAHNMSSLVDSYRCMPWGPPTNIGGDAQGAGPGFISKSGNHKITLPEVQWLAPQLEELPGAAGAGNCGSPATGPCRHSSVAAACLLSRARLRPAVSGSNPAEEAGCRLRAQS